MLRMNQKQLPLSEAAITAATDPIVKSTKKLSDSTVHIYVTAVNQLINFFSLGGQDGGARDVTTIQASELFEFQEWLEEQPISVESANTYKRTIKTVFNKLRKRGYAVCNAADAFETRKSPRRIKAASLESYWKMLGSSGLRDSLMCAIAAEGGARLGGLISMKVSTTKLWQNEDGELCLATWVMEKGDKPRIVYGLNLSATLMSAWLQVRSGLLKTLKVKDHDAVFIATDTGLPLSRHTVPSVFKEMSQRARIPTTDPTNCHSFRHRFAIERAKAGMPMHMLKDLLGHADSGTTEKVYAVLQDVEIEHGFFAKINRPKYDPG